MSTEAPPAPSTEAKPGEPAKTPAPTPTPTTPPAADTGGEGSPEAIRRDLANERRDRQRLERELQELRDATATEEEKKLNGARAEGEKAATARMLERIVKSDIKTAATGKFADPADAVVHLGDLKRFVGKDDEVDDKAIAQALADLLKEKPYLASRGTAAPLPGGSANTPPTGSSFNDTLRRKMRGER